MTLKLMIKNPNTPPILLTSAVRVSAPYTKLVDEKERVALTIESIEKWLFIDKNLRIVLCDGSGYDFSKIVSESFPGANIECLYFNNNRDLVLAYGKGFGEGEIVQYAIDNSKHLRNSEYFAKCTSKLWVPNFFQLLVDWNGQLLCDCGFTFKNKYWATSFDYVDTKFYIVSKAFYLENLARAHTNVRDHDGHSLEVCFRDEILTRKIGGVMFNHRPLYGGVSGSSATRYRATNGFRDKIKYRIRRVLLTKNSRFEFLCQ
jgi:hypothetical protein